MDKGITLKNTPCKYRDRIYIFLHNITLNILNIWPGDETKHKVSLGVIDKPVSKLQHVIMYIPARNCFSSYSPTSII